MLISFVGGVGHANPENKEKYYSLPKINATQAAGLRAEERGALNVKPPWASPSGAGRGPVLCFSYIELYEQLKKESQTYVL